MIHFFIPKKKIVVGGILKYIEKTIDNSPIVLSGEYVIIGGGADAERAGDNLLGTGNNATLIPVDGVSPCIIGFIFNSQVSVKVVDLANSPSTWYSAYTASIMKYSKATGTWAVVDGFTNITLNAGANAWQGEITLPNVVCDGIGFRINTAKRIDRVYISEITVGYLI